MIRSILKKFSLGSIYVKLLVFFIIIAIVPILTITYVNFNSDIGREALENAHLKSVEAIANLKAERVESFFLERLEDMQSIQNDFNIRVHLPILKDYINDQDHPDYIRAKQSLDSQLKPFQRSKKFLLDVILVGPNGNVMYVTGNVHKEDELGTPFPRQDVVDEGKGHIHYSEIFESPFLSEGFELLMSAPVYGFDDELIGVIIFGIDMNSVYGLIQDYTGLGDTGETLIGRKMVSHMGTMKDGHMAMKEGDHVLFLNPLRHDPNAALRMAVFYDEEKAFPIKEAVDGRSGFGQSIDYRSESVIASWKPLHLPSHDLQWGIVAKVDTKEAFGSEEILRRRILAIGLVTTILVLVLSFLVSRSISNPIMKLYDATQQLRKRNFKVSVNIKTRDELERLGDTFNKTAEALSKIDEEHKQIDRAKTKFLSITSHELRSPMTPMKAQLQMLVGEYFGKINAKQKESMNIVLRNTERLDYIIIDLLDISRLEAARLKFRFIKANLNVHINRVVEEMKGFLPEKNIEIVTNIHKLFEIEVDPDRIMQVLRNLINNAKKFSKPNTKIFVEAKLKKNMILFSVKDQGVGISIESQKRIFEPFFQAEQTMYREYSGTGLGLAICRGIVESQKGRIWVESEKGKGSTFFFTVPLKPVRDIEPIKLLLSEEENIDKMVEDIFKDILGPMGPQEFENFEKENKLTKENLFKYLHTLNKQKILEKENIREFKRRVLIIFGNKK